MLDPRRSAGISWTTMDEAWLGFSWISMLVSMLAFRPAPAGLLAVSFMGVEGNSWGDGLDQSLGFLRIPGRLRGGEETICS